MTKTKYTSAPWIINSNGVISGGASKGYNGIPICDMRTQCNENAKLIAAAPDLLNSLEYLVEIVENAIDCGLFKSIDGNKPDIQALREAYTAIAKATND